MNDLAKDHHFVKIIKYINEINHREINGRIFIKRKSFDPHQEKNRKVGLLAMLAFLSRTQKLDKQKLKKSTSSEFFLNPIDIFNTKALYDQK